MSADLSCPLCGHAFNPAEEPACASCPLHSGCNLVCCPACGYQTVDVGQSWLARMASSLIPDGEHSQDADTPPQSRRQFARFFRGRGRRRRWRHLFHDREVGDQRLPFTLLDAQPGSQVRVVGFSPGISPARKSQLQAYGLVPGYWVDVLQHSPVTVIKIEHSEVAMENDLAHQVWVVEKGPAQSG